MQHISTSHGVLPALIDYRQHHNASSTFAYFPSDDDEPCRVSFLEYGRACQRVARAVTPEGITPRGEVVGVIAIVDTLTYLALVGGFTRAGLTPCLISPRNSPEAICHLLRKTSAHRLFATTAAISSTLRGVEEEMKRLDYEFSVVEMPTFDDIFPHLGRETADHPFEDLPVPNRDTFYEGTELYLHSSGSTGMPKPIGYIHDFIYKMQYMDMYIELAEYHKQIVFNSGILPTFHTIGFHFQLMYTLIVGGPICLFKPQRHPNPPILPTPSNLLELTKKTKANAVFVVPSILESWVHEPETVAFLKTLEIIGFGGAPLSTEVGDKLAGQGCRVISVYGITETGALSRFFNGGTWSAEDWSWVRLANNITPRLVPHGDDVYELQILKSDTHPLAVLNLPDTPGYTTQDLWLKHPTKELWRMVGRMDDVIVLANGEKTVPAPIEGGMMLHPSVQGAVVFGEGRFQVGLLVELKKDVAYEDDESARNDLWPVLDEANRGVAAFSRILKEMIIFTSSDKPLPRTPKNTVSRKAALKLYSSEIDSLYENLDNQSRGNDVSPPKDWTEREVTEWLGVLIRSIADGQIDDEQDLFAQGFDSLSATFLRNHIVAALRNVRDTERDVHVPQDFIYMHPSVRKLTKAVLALNHAGEEDVSVSKYDAIEAAIHKHTEGLSSVSSPRQRVSFGRRLKSAFGSLMNLKNASRASEGRVVLLTGSTGSVGAPLLALLLSLPNIRRVYAFNRPSSTGKTSQERHTEAFNDKGIDPQLLSLPKLKFLEGEAHAERLGLEAATYNELLGSVNIVIHNAWKLDFNMGLSSFEPHIQATRNLLNLGLNSARGSSVRFLFTSSIAVASSWPRENGPLPEADLSDHHWCFGNGYGESKYVAEQVVARARSLGLHATTLRIGQIAGNDTNGAWSVTDWVPSILQSSVHVGSLPDASGVISWIGVDAVCQAIIDVATSKEAPPAVVNLAHPRPIAWHAMMGDASKALVSKGVTDKPLPLVPFALWASTLEDGVSEKLRATRLLPFFRALAQGDHQVASLGSKAVSEEALGAATLSLTQAKASSETVQQLTPLTHADVERWIGYWKEKNMFATA